MKPIQTITYYVACAFAIITLSSFNTADRTCRRLVNIFLTENDNAELARLKQYGTRAQIFCKQNHLNDSICFLVDMNIPSGKYRFFVYSFKDEVISLKGIVAHGCCNRSFLKKPEFSNVPGSGCSSLGRYKTGVKYNGRFGKAWKLYGLDTTNSNAYRRNIVLHSYYLVPDNETYPVSVCNSLGCIMVSEKFLQSVGKLIDASSKPLLIWVMN